MAGDEFVSVEDAIAIRQQQIAQQGLLDWYAHINTQWEQWVSEQEYVDSNFGVILRGNPAIYAAFVDRQTNKISDNAFVAKIGRILQPTTRGGGSSGPSVAQRAANIAAEIRNLAQMFGLPEQDYGSIAWQAAQNNWDIEQIRDLLAGQITAETAQRPGYVSDIVGKTKSFAADYFVKVSEEEALNFAKRVAAGDLDPDSIKTEMARRAKSQYSWLADAIDAGATLKEYFDPHRKTIAEMMEISPDSVNLVDDPDWSVVVNRPPDANDATRREMTLSEVQQLVRSKEKWSTTQNARSIAAEGAASIASIMGAL